MYVVTSYKVPLPKEKERKKKEKKVKAGLDISLPLPVLPFLNMYYVIKCLYATMHLSP